MTSLLPGSSKTSSKVSPSRISIGASVLRGGYSGEAGGEQVLNIRPNSAIWAGFGPTRGFGSAGVAGERRIPRKLAGEVYQGLIGGVGSIGGGHQAAIVRLLPRSSLGPRGSM